MSFETYNATKMIVVMMMMMIMLIMMMIVICKVFKSIEVKKTVTWSEYTP